MTNSIWVTNMVPTNQFHFMTVIYPVPPGGTPPTMGRLDNYTVAVTNGSQVDVISFNSATTNPCTLIVNSPYLASTVSPVALPPTPLYTNATASVPATASSSGGSAGVSLVAPSNLRIIPPTAINIGIEPSGFSPAPGYYAWWNPDALDGANFAPVASWLDLSSAALNASQSTFVNQPTLLVTQQNNHNCLLFNGISDYVAFPLANISQPCEIICAACISNTSGNMFIFGNNSGKAAGFGIRNGQHYMTAGDGMAGGTPTNGWVVFTAIMNQTSSSYFVNGSQILPAGNIGGNNFTGTAIGTWNNGGYGYFWNGLVGDVIVYTNIISDATRQTIEAGLHAKHGF